MPCGSNLNLRATHLQLMAFAEGSLRFWRDSSNWGEHNLAIHSNSKVKHISPKNQGPSKELYCVLLSWPRASLVP